MHQEPPDGAQLRSLPTPCTRSAVEQTVERLEGQRQLTAPLEAEQREALVELGMQRKQPITGGRRGAKAAPMPAMDRKAV